MNPVTFPEANVTYGPPADMAESQVQPIPAYSGTVEGGSCDGSQQVVVAWMPDELDRARIAAGHPIFLSMLGGLAPHMLTTGFHEATHPA